MLKKKKLVVLFVILALIISSFALQGCVKKKDAAKKEQDSRGLPLTKASALRLWQGDWKCVLKDGKLSDSIYRNEIQGKRFLIMGNVNEIREGVNLWQYNNHHLLLEETKYDERNKELTIKCDLGDGYGSITSKIRFISRDKILHSDDITAEATFVRVQ